MQQRLNAFVLSTGAQPRTKVHLTTDAEASCAMESVAKNAALRRNAADKGPLGRKAWGQVSRKGRSRPCRPDGRPAGAFQPMRALSAANSPRQRQRGL